MGSFDVMCEAETRIYPGGEGASSKLRGRDKTQSRYVVGEAFGDDLLEQFPEAF